MASTIIETLCKDIEFKIGDHIKFDWGALSLKGVIVAVHKVEDDCKFLVRRFDGLGWPKASNFYALKDYNHCYIPGSWLLWYLGPQYTAKLIPTFPYKRKTK